MKVSRRLIHQNQEDGTMLMITQHDNLEDNSIIFELEDNGVKFILESETLDGIYRYEGIPFMISSPSFPNISETVTAAPEELRSMPELYNRLLLLAQKGDL